MSDQHMNPALRKQVQGLRGTIFHSASQAAELPDNFIVEPVDDWPCARITDLDSGESLEVGLCDLRGAILAINAFCKGK